MKKKTRCALLLLAALPLAGRMPGARAATTESLMTEGKVAADLGDYGGAERAFAKVATDAALTEGARAEALVRLGVVQRTLGKTQASAAAFRKAMQSPARDAGITRLLAVALSGVAPDQTRWASQWSKVRLASKPGATDLRPTIQWPGPGPQGVRAAFPAQDPVTFDLEDVSLLAFLHHLLTPWRPGDKSCPTCDWPGARTTPGFEGWPESYQPPADVQRLDFVVHAGVGSFADVVVGPRVTVKVSGMPWNELFENVLASNGLGFVIEKNLLYVAHVDNLGPIERLRNRTYGGTAINLNFLSGRLEDMFGPFSDITGFRLVPDADLHVGECPPASPCTSWYMTLRVSERPSLQVLDLVLMANDLVATRTSSPPDGKPGTTALRISKLADAKGEAVDLSRLVPASRP